MRRLAAKVSSPRKRGFSGRLPGAVCVLALLPGLVTAGGSDAACVALASHPDGAPLARFALRAGDPVFTITYVHSVTRTPVVERYRADGATVVQTEIRFVQHGPGLPTEADAGGAYAQRDGQIVVSMQRSFDVVVMRVHADQAPRLAASAWDPTDLAAWGNRAIALRALAGACDAH